MTIINNFSFYDNWTGTDNVEAEWDDEGNIVEHDIRDKVVKKSKKAVFIIVLILPFPTLYFLHISYQGLLKVIVTNFLLYPSYIRPISLEWD